MEDIGVNTKDTGLHDNDNDDDDNNIEMRPFVSEKDNNKSDEEDNEQITSPIKLLLIRTPWYIIGLVILITGVDLSQYTIHVPYQAQCDDADTATI